MRGGAMKPPYVTLLCVLLSILLFCEQSLSQRQTNDLTKSPNFEVSPEYRDAVLKLMLVAVNDLIGRLKLNDIKPVTGKELTDVYVGPPTLNSVFGGPNGSIRTEKYFYAFGLNGKLTSLGRLDLFNPSRFSDEQLNLQYRKRAIPRSQVDTNSAWQAMQPYLNAGILDLERLNRECRFQLKHLEWGSLHVPKYTANWTRGDTNVAALTILMPEKELLSLRIEDPKFNLRPGLKLPGENANPK